MPSAWIDQLAVVYVPLSIASALLVVADIFLAGRRQPMAIMDAVWPLTMLYWGPVGLAFYAWFGRAPAAAHGTGEHGTGEHGAGEDHGHRAHHAERPMWQATFNGATHCGAGCALGDFLGDWLAFATAFTLFGSVLAGTYLLAFAFAYLFGIVFQYFSIAPMKGLGLRDGLVAAIRVDTLSLLAYEVGMFAWMAARASLYPDLEPTRWSYWLMMQVAMVLGFCTTYPVNWWLIRRGTKEAM